MYPKLNSLTAIIPGKEYPCLHLENPSGHLHSHHPSVLPEAIRVSATVRIKYLLFIPVKELQLDFKKFRNLHKWISAVSCTQLLCSLWNLSVLLHVLVCTEGQCVNILYFMTTDKG
jgi:hypothetical protein